MYGAAQCHLDAFPALWAGCYLRPQVAEHRQVDRVVGAVVEQIAGDALSVGTGSVLIGAGGVR